ncbi:hypothetical protein N7456_000378 [Penicillium angulare]|uniref:Uncharacterized protein n=1 Tax=Penicillium angulare TaxID=116970 RepID=A0A9W9KS25_9EURO|nr:hypothetical protein N7456_000378 [Penicillium angulare]
MKIAIAAVTCMTAPLTGPSSLSSLASVLPDISSHHGKRNRGGHVRSDAFDTAGKPTVHHRFEVGNAGGVLPIQLPCRVVACEMIEEESSQDRRLDFF